MAYSLSFVGILLTRTLLIPHSPLEKSISPINPHWYCFNKWQPATIEPIVSGLSKIAVMVTIRSGNEPREHTRIKQHYGTGVLHITTYNAKTSSSDEKLKKLEEELYEMGYYHLVCKTRFPSSQ